MLWESDQLHRTGFSGTGEHTTATAHALVGINKGPLCTKFRVVLHLGRSELASLRGTDLAGTALCRVNSGYETARCVCFLKADVEHTPLNIALHYIATVSMAIAQ